MKELRIGLVLYGGVSLAIYMSGIITEIWNVLRTTQPDREPAEANQAPAVAFDDCSGGAAACCRELLTELECQYGAPRIRVVVDTVAGTSAGDLGGAALAKAVVEGADLRVLNDTWIENAYIANLKSEPGASTGDAAAPVRRDLPMSA